jgi:protein SCO1/2
MRTIAAFLILLLTAGAAFAAEDDDLRDTMPRYLLEGPNGRAVTADDFPGRFQLITFGYTFCPDICPTTLATMSQVMTQLGDLAGRVQPLFISVDPERDTVAVVRRYTEYFDPRIVGLTGSPELVRHAADRFRVRYEKHVESGAAPDRYSVDHTAGMFLLGPNGRYITKFAYTMPARDVVARMRVLLAEEPR